MAILGLDISTSWLGYCVLEDDGTLLENNALNLTKIEGLMLKADEVKLLISRLKHSYDIKHIFIEQSLNAFRPGLSSAHVILTLGKFNGIVSYICHTETKLLPDYIGASTARKSCGIKVERGENAKKIVLENVLVLEPGFKVTYTKLGNPVAGTYDRADSLVIARAGLIQCQNQKK